MDKKILLELVKYLGGKENITKFWNCMTRLRFKLNDYSLINEEEIIKLKGVLGIQKQNDQYQVIVGPSANKYFSILEKELSFSSTDVEEKNSKNLISKLLDVVSGVFGPIIPAIAGAGMLKGILSGLLALKILDGSSETVKIFDLIASGVFYFLPFYLAVSAARIFKTSEYLALAMASALMYPTLIDAANTGSMDFFHFFGLPIPVIKYSSTVIPIIMSVWAMKYIHRWVDKYMPEVLRTIFTPTITLIISIPLTLIVIGPLGTYFGQIIAWLINFMFSLSNVVAGFVVAGIRPALTVGGMHHVMTPMFFNNFETKGYDFLMPLCFMANMAMGGAAFGVFFRTKDKNKKSIIISSTISAILGITEPALFGVLIKYKMAFVAASLGAAIAGGFISFFGVRIYGYILSSIVSLPAYIGPYFIYAILGVVIAISTSAMLSYLLVKNVDESN